MTSTDVSVVMPVYNGMPYLQAAVESILSQSDVSFELVVVDDGSIDETKRYLSSIEDPRLRILHNEQNRGLVYSLNRGVTDARADVIARLDADDRATPGRLRRQFALLQSNPRAVLVGGGFRIVDLRSGVFLRHVVPPTQHAAIRVMLHFINPLHHSTVMFRRSAWEAAGRYMASNYPAEDYDLWIRLSEIGAVLAVHEDVAIVGYRPTGISVQNLARQSAMLLNLAGGCVQSTLSLVDVPPVLEKMLGYSLKSCAEVSAANELVLDVTSAVRREVSRQGIPRWPASEGAAHVLHAAVRYRTEDGTRCWPIVASLPFRDTSVTFAIGVHRLKWHYRRIRASAL